MNGNGQKSVLRLKYRKEYSDDDSDNTSTSSSSSSNSNGKDVEDKKPIYKKKYRRCVRRSGACALRKKHRIGDLSYYTTDVFTSLVDSRWRHILIICILSFIVSWFLFALLWWVIAFAHGDLTDSQLYAGESEPCVTHIHDIMSAFLFSMETQYTTGFGTRSPTTQCPEAVFLLCVQSIFGILQQSVMVGVVFAKLARPKARLNSIRFSEKAVVCQRDGKMCLMFRIADMRKSHMIGCKVRAWFIQNRMSKEGEVLRNYQKKLRISVEEGGSDVFLLWPITLVHCIDSKSPLYNMSAMKLIAAEFEVIVSLVCVAETTGQTTEARRSYAPSEVIWGHRFHTVFMRQKNSTYIDYGLFDKTVQVDTPLCAAIKLKSFSYPSTPVKLMPPSPWPSDTIKEESQEQLCLDQNTFDKIYQENDKKVLFTP